MGSPAHSTSAQAPVVTTANGLIQGFVDSATGQQCFWGIPYAEAPIGDLRFKRPVAKAPWSGVFEATKFGNAGPQIFDTTEGSYEEFTGLKENASGKPWIGSEDNLTLNVWTNGTDGAKKPVMVWIHGGANWLEASRLHTYHGDRFVDRGDVVFVSINYRLGIFGWLDVSELGGEEYEGSHSNSLRDQTMALQWIRNNIHAFGGDPENITVMGESAGSIDISWLLVNGHLDGIAKRVVLMSGIAGLLGLSGDLNDGFQAEHAKAVSCDLLKAIGVQDWATLKTMPTDALMDRFSAYALSQDTLFTLDSIFWPRVSAFTPIDPIRGAKGQGGKNIDVVTGYTNYEMGLWLFWDETLDQHDFKWYADRLIYRGKGLDPQAQSVYQDAFAGDPDGMLGMHLMGDSTFVMPTYRFADALAERGQNVRVFQYSRESNDRQKALHAADQVFFFGKINTHTAEHLIGLPNDADDQKARETLSHDMMDCLLDYAKGTDLATRDGLKWPRYDANQRSVMSFDHQSKIVQDPTAKRRAWWYREVYDPAL